MTAKTVTEVVAAIVSELTPLGSEERRRVIQASLVLLGDAPSAFEKNPRLDERHDVGDEDLPARARAWIKQNGLSLEQMHQVFHLRGTDVEIIASNIPGNSNRDKVRHAYLLMGAARLITLGEPRFDDKEARSLCERFGIFDGTNHTKYVKGGNELAGSKDKGWALTAPGLKQAALLISELSRA
jgi:hypothetical protein